MKSVSLASYGIPAAFAELGVHTGYIVWKAKSENLNKHPIGPTDENSQNTQVIGFEVTDPDDEDYFEEDYS